MTFDYGLLDIIRTNVHKFALAMVEHPRACPNLDWRSGMFILTPKKQCTKCGEWKDRGEFGKDKHASDGLTYQCKMCRRGNYKRYRETYPGAKEKHRVIAALWRIVNREKVREINKKSYENNKEKALERNRSWLAKNPGKFAEYHGKRRAHLNNNGGNITAKEWVELKAKYGNKCIVPGCNRIDVQMDHVIPLSLGGTHTIDNVQPLCTHHNTSKKAKVIDYR
jgi:5-methylcytosine-specific restriction endonuclease McrA